MTRSDPFTVMSGSTVLARIPLLPACGQQGNRPGAADPLLAEGMYIASRHASAAGGAERDQVAVTTRAYELRARFRPTPHGVFAGVAAAEITSGAPDLLLGAGHHAQTYPSPAWLALFSERLLDMPGILRNLTLTTSNLVVHRGRRIEHEQPATPGAAGPQHVSLRATDACLLVLRLCENGASYQEIAAQFSRTWPAATEERVRAVVLELVRGGFLLTDLNTRSVQADPLGHLLARLPGSCSLRQLVERLRNHLREADRHPPGAPERLAFLKAARGQCDELAHAERPLSTDVAADARIKVPATLLAEAAKAAGVLWRMSQARDPLADYHQRFLDRFGQDRFVPLLDATDPASGLGDIDADTHGDATSADRGAILARLLSDAAARGQVEAELDDAAIDALDEQPADVSPPPTAEVYARVFAASEQDLAAGRLSLAIYNGGTQEAGSTAGRFTALLPGTATGPVTRGAELIAEVAVRPRTPELAGIAVPTGFVTPRIPVGVPARDGDLDPRSLLLVSAGNRLLLWSAEHDRQVIPVLYSRIGPRYIPPAARLLQDLGAHGCRPWHGWSWAPLQHAAFQPRVRYKRTILSPARWRLPADVIAAARDRPGWGPAIDAWQMTTTPRPPQTVVAEDNDRRLPLNLRRADDRELLRRYVNRGLSAVTELPGGQDAIQGVIPGPAGRHALELAIPLARQQAAAPGRRPSSATRARPTGDGLHLPGGQWLSAAIPSPRSCHDEILRQLAGLVAGMEGDFDRWFWLRYHNAGHGPHLRVRFRGTPSVLGGKVLPSLSQWCTDLIAQRLASGFIVEPYDPEIERYGGDKAIEAAEHVFDTDSHLVLATLTLSPDADQLLIMAALSAAAISCAVADGAPEALARPDPGRVIHRRVCELRLQLRQAADADSAVLSPVRAGWDARHAALSGYRDALHDTQRPHCASSLIHMHANRLLGDGDSERLARALAADFLARQLRR